MASGSTARLRTDSCQASAEHFQQCAEFPLLRDRALGSLAVTVLPHRVRREGLRYRVPQCRQSPPWLRRPTGLIIGFVVVSSSPCMPVG
jgi:hypothetical protein